MNCEHTPAAVCFLCSDQVSWWVGVRLAMELGEEPPNAPRERKPPRWREFTVVRTRQVPSEYASRYTGRPS